MGGQAEDAQWDQTNGNQHSACPGPPVTRSSGTCVW
ncbi:hypothetical protein MRX96_048696, partial [Rhipicephalus microplus]